MYSVTNENFYHMVCAAFAFPQRSSVGTGTKKDDKIWYEIRLMIALEFFLDKDSWNLRN